jgi:CRISPR-associated protein Csm4
VKTFRLRIAPRSGFLTPLHADTLFGHLAWAWRHRRGADELVALLDRFDADPPFLLSDGFPAGFLPMPRLTAGPEDAAALAAEWESRVPGLDGRAVLGQVAKRIKKSGFAPAEILAGLSSTGLSWRTVVGKMIEILPGVRRPDPSVGGRYFEVEGFDGLIRLAAPPAARTVLTMKNTIDRRSGTVGPGGLFSIRETFHPYEIEIWVGIRSFEPDDLLELFRDVAAIGFGKRKSAGQGSFEILGFEEAALPHAANPTHFLSLSGFAPAANDPVRGAWTVRVKRGKIGENWAEFGSFLKKPLFIFEPGSIFESPDPAREYFGRMIRDVHPNPAIRHYACALPLFVRLA